MERILKIKKNSNGSGNLCYVKWKGHETPLNWVDEATVPKKIVADFQQINRRSKLISSESLPRPQRQRPSGPHKRRRYTSGSSVDGTPEYLEQPEPVAPPPPKPPASKRPRQPSGQKNSAVNKLHLQYTQNNQLKLAEVTQLLEKYPKHPLQQQHRLLVNPQSSGIKIATSSQQQRSNSQSSGIKIATSSQQQRSNSHSAAMKIATSSQQQRSNSSNSQNSAIRVTTSSQQRQESPNPSKRGPDASVLKSEDGAQQADTSLAQLLARLPLAPRPLVRDIKSCYFTMEETDAGESPWRIASPNPPSQDQLLRLIVERQPDGTNGNPPGLAAALLHAPSFLINAPLPSNPSARCLLHLAANAGHRAADLLLHLLVAGANPDVVDSKGFTPLMLAASAGNAQAVERLLQFRASPDLDNTRNGVSALSLAADAKHWETMAALLCHGAEFSRLIERSGFDPTQLDPWTERLVAPLLATLQMLLGTRYSDPSIVQAAHLSTLSPAGRRTFVVPGPDPATKGPSAYLLVGAVAEFDGLGGVRLRRPVGCDTPLSDMALNNHPVQPLICAGGLSVYPLNLVAQKANKIRISLSADCQYGTRFKLLALVVRLCGKLDTG